MTNDLKIIKQLEKQIGKPLPRLERIDLEHSPYPPYFGYMLVEPDIFGVGVDGMKLRKGIKHVFEKK